MFSPRRIEAPARGSESVERGQPEAAGSAGAVPAMAGERHAPSPHRDPFLLEKNPLSDHAPHVGPEADRPAGVHHTVPGHTGRAPLHGVADSPRGPRAPEQRGDLPIGGHAAGGNLADQAVHGSPGPPPARPREKHPPLPPAPPP